MPLPDESPRQSVANLIGRFENQTKRQSLPPPKASSRSTSVLSNVTSDSSKEEVKDKREWPPKSTSSSEKTSPIVPSSSWTRRPLVTDQSSSPPETQPANVPGDPVPRPGPDMSVLDKKKVPLPPERQSSIGEPTPSAAPTSNASKLGAKTPIPKTPTTATPRSSLKPTTNTSPKQVSSTQSLKPQHTGTSSRKPVSKPSPASPRPVSRTTPSSASRAKSPASTSTTRPKTPSSGLFAPTAASLARSRNAAPQPPTPTKKTTLSSAAADRLSKPTAASLSRARTPTPARGAAKPALRGGAVRGAPKAATSSSPIRPKKDSPPPLPTASDTSAVAALAIIAGVSIAVGSEIDAKPDDEHENVHQENGHVDTEPHEEIHEIGLVEKPELQVATGHADVTEPEETPEHEEGLLQVEGGVRTVESPQPVDHGLSTLVGRAEEPEVLVEDEIPIPGGTTDIQLVPEELADDSKSQVHVGHDIEDIVNLLEFSKARPASIASIPDEVHEIPDEE